MFSVKATPEGIDSLNQHCTVSALVWVFDQLKLPLGSGTVTLAFPAKMAPLAAGGRKNIATKLQTSRGTRRLNFSLGRG
jgi:hypothetical protein